MQTTTLPLFPAALQLPVKASNQTATIAAQPRRASSWLAQITARCWYDPSIRAASFVFVLTRMLVFLLFIITTHVTFQQAPVSFGDEVHDVSIRVRRYSIPQELRNLAMRSDGGWYIAIARDGYEKIPYDATRAHNWGFFPLYPLTVRVIGAVTGNYRLVGIVLSNLYFFLALIVLHKLVLAYGFERSLANRAIFYIAAFPTSYFFSLPWTTSLFFLTTVTSVYAAKRGHWWLAGLVAGLASATRYNGIFLAPVLTLMYWQAHRDELRTYKVRANALALLLAPSGLLAFMAYLYSITGNAFAYSGVQTAWKVRWGVFLQPLFTFLISPFELSASWNFRLINFLAALIGLVACAAWLKRREWGWALYLFLSIIVPLSMVTLEGQARYLVSLFPLFIMLAIWGRSPAIDQVIRTVSLVLLTLLTVFYGFFFSSALI